MAIPAWMFDRAARAAWRVGTAPYVDIAVLTALATLLQDVTSVSDAPSQLRDSSGALGAHDANRGDVHAVPRLRLVALLTANARQFDLFCDPHAAAQTPQWQALPAETRHTFSMHIGVERHTSQPDLCHFARKSGFPRRQGFQPIRSRILEFRRDLPRAVYSGNAWNIMAYLCAFVSERVNS
jgi:hypothetical protein